MIGSWLTIAWKDLRLLSRDRVALFWVIGFPLVFAGFFGSVMRAGVERDSAPLPVVVVEVPGSRRADDLAGGLERAGLSVSRASIEGAREAVRTGEAVAFVRPDPEPLGNVELGVDPSRAAESAMLQGLVMRMLAPEFVPLTVRPPEIALQSVVTSPRGPQSGFEIVFPGMILWGLLGCAATFAVALVGERSTGTLLRLRAAPIARGSILGGKATACIATSSAVVALLSALGLLLLDVRVEQPAKYAAAVAASVMCFTGITMALGVIGKTDQAVAGAGWSTLIVLAMLGGAMVPLSLMPEWLQSVSDLSPVKWAIRALEGAAWRGDTWSDLARPIGMLAGLGAAAFAAGATALSLEEPS